MGKPDLRAVADGEAAPSRHPESVAGAVAEGSRRDVLRATRARISALLDSQATPAHTIAALSRQLLECDKEIRAIDVASEQEAERGGQVDDEAFDAEAI